jgi:uncharacterized membrane protein
MTKLEKVINDWIVHDLIKSEQGSAILKYEEEKPSSSWVLYAFLTLGACIIGIGVVSMVAANWENIPSWLKLIIDFTILGALSYQCYTSLRDQKEVHFEIYVVLLMMACLASIGLISQIYHTGGELYQALLFWSLITGGIAFISKRIFAPFICAGGFFYGISGLMIKSDLVRGLFDGGVAPAMISIPFMLVFFMLILKRLTKYENQFKALSYWLFLDLIFSLGALEVSSILYSSRSIGFSTFIPGFIFGGLALIFTWKSDLKQMQKILLAVCMGVFLCVFYTYSLGFKSDIGYALCTIISLISFSLLMASLQARKLFQFLIMMIGLRFLILYFQAFGGLAMTGLGLIFSGVMVMGTVILWNKYRKQIGKFAEEVVK